MFYLVCGESAGSGGDEMTRESTLVTNVVTTRQCKYLSRSTFKLNWHRVGYT